MSDVLVVSCRLCLQPDEEPSMITITRPLIAGVSSMRLSVCALCAKAIAVGLAQRNNQSLEEVLKNDSTRAPDGAASGDSAAAPEADPPVVLQGQPGPEASPVDRLEPEVPAGGESAAPGAEQSSEVSARARRVRGGEAT